MPPSIRYTGEKGYPKLIDEEQLIAANEKRSNRPQLPKKTEAQKVLRRLCGTPPSEQVEQSVTYLLNGLANYPNRIQHRRSPTPVTYSKTQEALDNTLAQHAILRFEKHKGNPARPLEAHHERQKEQYASNPDIDTSRSKYNFHIVKPEGRYYHFIQNRIEQAGCRTRKDSTRFVDTLITASPEFFKKKSPKEIQAFFQRAADFLIGRVGRENIVSAVVHMDEKTPHLHLVFVPLTEDNRLCAKEIIGNRANLTKMRCSE